MNQYTTIKRFSTNSWFPFIGHFSLFAIVYTFLYAIGEFDTFPNDVNILGWDATMYESIKSNGYFLGNEIRKSDTGFFPLFPLIWRWIGASPLGISILNFIIFVLSFYWLAKEFVISNKVLWIALSMPSIMFFLVPYTESLFFISATLLLIGWNRKKYWLVVAATVLACISRPSFLYFIPAISFCYIYFRKNDLINKSIKYNTYSILIGVFLGFIVQLYIFDIMTGNPFAFFESRSNNNSFSFPSFPLTTWRGSKLLWLDGLALMICLCTMILSAYILFNSFLKKNKENLATPFAIIFSLGYISTIFIHIIFFNIKDPSGPTSLLGLNRFVFTSPFFILLLQKYWPSSNKESQLNKWVLAILLICLLMLGGFAFSKYPEQLRPVIYICSIAYFWANRHRFRNFWIGFYFVHLVLQVICFNNFISGLWVG